MPGGRLRLRAPPRPGLAHSSLLDSLDTPDKQHDRGHLARHRGQLVERPLAGPAPHADTATVWPAGACGLDEKAGSAALAAGTAQAGEGTQAQTSVPVYVSARILPRCAARYRREQASHLPCGAGTGPEAEE